MQRVQYDQCGRVKPLSKKDLERARARIEEAALELDHEDIHELKPPATAKTDMEAAVKENYSNLKLTSLNVNVDDTVIEIQIADYAQFKKEIPYIQEGELLFAKAASDAKDRQLSFKLAPRFTPR